MDYQNDLQRVQTRYSESQQKYYRDRNLKKMFNLNDQQLAFNKYSDKYNINPVSLSEQQKLTAISEYKSGKNIFLEGANTYSGFLYENYGLGTPEVETAIKIEEKTRSYWSKLGEEIAEMIPFGAYISKENREPIKNLITQLKDEEGNLSFVEQLQIHTEILMGTATNLVPSEKADDIISALYRGAGGLVRMGGSALTEAWENKNWKANNLVNTLEDKEGFLEDYSKYKELSSLRGDEFGTSEQKEINELTKKYGDSFVRYDEAKSYQTHETKSLKILGETVQAIGSTIENLEVLNNEYTKEYKAGKIQYDEWFNIKGVSFSKSLRDPRFWFNQAPEVVGQVGGLIALTTLTPGVPDEYAVAGYVIDGLPINFMFSASESNQVREEAREAGYSEEEAQIMASKTFGANVLVQGVLGAAPGAVTKLASKSKAYQSFINTNYAQRIIGRATTVGIDAMFEGIEEVLQDQIRDSHLKEDYKFMAEVSGETFILGALGGLFGGAGMVTQEVAFNNTYKNLMEDESIAPLMKNFEKEALNEGKTKLEAKDIAMENITGILQGTAKAQEIMEMENKEIQKAVIDKAIKAAKDIQSQSDKIMAEQLKQSSVEERNSEIQNTNFKFSKTENNERIIEGPSKSSQVDDNTAITNMVMQEFVKKYDDINYDEKSNTYTSKERMTKFAKQTNDKIEKLQNLNDKVKNLNENLDPSGVRGYIKRNNLSMNDIHDLQENKAMTTTQYINSMRQLKETARDNNIERKIQLGNRLNDMVDNFDNISLSEYNKLSDDIKKEFSTTLNNGLKQLTEIGSITANDAATFKNQAKIFKQEIAEATKKKLEEATKTIETQKETEVKMKETQKKLKAENKQLTLDLGEQVVPQRVKTVKEIKADKTIGKTPEQAKIVKMVDVKTEKEVKDVSEIKEKPTKPVSPIVKYLKSKKITSKGIAVNYGKGEVESGIYGDAMYFNDRKIKLADNKLANRNFIDLNKLKMYIPKDIGEARNLSNMLQKQHELRKSINDNTVANIFLAEEVKSTLRSYTTMKSVNDKLIDAGLVEDTTYDRYDTKSNYDKLFNAKEIKWINDLKEEMGFESYEDINFVESGLFDFIETIEEIKDFATELELSTNKIMSILKKDDNIIRGLKYEGIDFRGFQKDTNKYQSVVYETLLPKTIDIKDIGLVKGKDIVKYINKQKEKENIKKNIIKEIC